MVLTSMNSEEWRKGFEDAMELAYVCVKDSKSLEEALNCLKKYIGSAKGLKQEKIKEELGLT